MTASLFVDFCGSYVRAAVTYQRDGHSLGTSQARVRRWHDGDEKARRGWYGTGADDGTMAGSIRPGTRYKGARVEISCMAPTTTEVRKVLSGLEEDERQSVLDYAKKLSGGSSGKKNAESLSKGNAPSYLAMADKRTYDLKREQVEKNKIPDPR